MKLLPGASVAPCHTGRALVHAALTTICLCCNVLSSPAEVQRVGSEELLAQRLEAGGGAGPDLAALLRIAGQDCVTATSQGHNEAEHEQLFVEWHEASDTLHTHLLQWIGNRYEQAA